MHLETEPKRSSERYPQFIEDPVHRFGLYYSGEKLRILIILSCLTIGDVVELQVPCKTVYHGLFTWSTTLCGDLKTIITTGTSSTASKPCPIGRTVVEKILPVLAGYDPLLDYRKCNPIDSETHHVIEVVEARLSALAGSLAIADETASANVIPTPFPAWHPAGRALTA